MGKAKDGSSFGSVLALIAVFAASVIAGYGVYVALDEMFADDEVATWIKIVVSIGIGAIALAAANVAWNRVRESQEEKLGDVEL